MEQSDSYSFSANVCFQSSAGLLMKSLDRDMFDADPMRELSGRRPLLSTDFQGQKIVLKVGNIQECSFALLSFGQSTVRMCYLFL